MLMVVDAIANLTVQHFQQIAKKQFVGIDVVNLPVVMSYDFDEFRPIESRIINLTVLIGT